MRQGTNDDIKNFRKMNLSTVGTVILSQHLWKPGPITLLLAAQDYSFHQLDINDKVENALIG